MDSRLWLKAGTIQRGRRMVDLAAELGISSAELSHYMSGLSTKKFNGTEKKVARIWERWDRQKREKEVG